MTEAPALDNSPADARLYRRIAWRLLPLLMACYVAAYLDRVNVGFAKLAMADELHFSEFVYGLGAGIFFIGYFVFEVPSNLMLHRIGARIWISRIMISWSLVSGACAFIQGPISFYVLRFLLGVAEAGFFPGILLYLTYWFPACRRGQVIALFMIAIPLAGLVGGPLSGAAMQAFDGVWGVSGWRWMFAVEALPALVLGLMLPVLLKSRVDQVGWLNPEEKARVTRAVAEGDPPAGEQPGSLRAVLSSPAMLLFGLIYFCCIMGQYGITFWLPTVIARVAHASPLAVGVYSALPYAVAVIAMVAVGRHSDRTQERRWHLIAPMVIGAAALAAVTLAGTSLAVSLTLLCVATAGILTATPMFWTLPTAQLTGRAAALGIAAINSVGNLAGFSSPLLVGWVSDVTGSPQAGLNLLAAILLAGAVIVAIATRLRRDTVHGQRA